MYRIYILCMQNACNGSLYNFFIAKFVNFGMILNLKRYGNVAIKWGCLSCLGPGRINITTQTETWT